MTQDERRALLGEATARYLDELVDQAPPAPPEVIAQIRPILTRPAYPMATAPAEPGQAA